MSIPMSEIFLSAVLAKTVITPQGEEIGKLHDLIMIPGEHFPEISQLLVQTHDKILSAPWQRVTLFNHFVISVTGALQSIPEYRQREGDVLLKRDLLDRQIVDVNGAKVVRVNDLKLKSFKDKLCVAAVDVGLRGLLRRMGYERIGERVATFFERQLPHHLISWDYVQLLGSNLSRLTLTVARDQLKEIHPADLAQIISNIPSDNIRAVLDALDIETAGEAIHELEPELRRRIISQLELARARSILEEMDPDEAADVIGSLPKEKALEILELMDVQDALEIRGLLEHGEDTAGGLMNSEFLATSDELTAEAALQLVRSRAAEVDHIYYLYILDQNAQLVGVTSLKDLLLNPPAARVAEFMVSSVKAVHVDSTPYEVMEVLAKYNFIAVPVLDAEERMAGIITVDDVLELFLPGTLRRKR